MKITIKCRFTDAVRFEGEYESLKHVVVQAVKDGANLDGANLDGANLDGANLTRANLTRANLTRANLTRANLYGANLYGANLDGANLTRANLTRANLDGANLYGANLDGANLDGANLTRANLEIFKKDLIAEVLKLPDELENLRDTIVAGKINGSSYTGDCACLAGTIAKNRGLDEISSGTEIKENGCVFVADSNSPRERWFMMIGPGQTPENHQPSKVALDWVNEAIVIRDHIRGKAAA